MRRGVAIAALVLVAVAACGQSSEPSPAGQEIVVEGRDAGFALSMRIESNVVDAGSPIGISAILTWEGADPTGTIWGSGTGPVTFGLAQIDGEIVIEAAMTADCAMHDYARLVPIAVPYFKSGGFSDDDPNAGFYRTFFADPVLRLPVGRWKVRAGASGYLVPCEMDAPEVAVSLEAEILVR